MSCLAHIYGVVVDALIDTVKELCQGCKLAIVSFELTKVVPYIIGNCNNKKGAERLGCSIKEVAKVIIDTIVDLLPLSGLIKTDGKIYKVQWFERARFEEHPENQAPYDVLLGLLA